MLEGDVFTFSARTLSSMNSFHTCPCISATPPRCESERDLNFERERPFRTPVSASSLFMSTSDVSTGLSLLFVIFHAGNRVKMGNASAWRLGAAQRGCPVVESGRLRATANTELQTPANHMEILGIGGPVELLRCSWQDGSTFRR